MRQFPLEMLEVTPGRVIEWRLRSAERPATRSGGDRQVPPARVEAGAGVPAARDRRASYNQDKHFTVAEESQGAADPVASWLAVTFEVNEPLDRGMMERALLSFVDRHEVLRCAFQRLAGEVSCAPVASDSLSLDCVEIGAFASTEAVRTFLVARFKDTIDTLSWPLFTMGAIERPDSATVYLALDHIVCDGLSMPIIVDEVMTTYEAYRRGRQPVLPPAAGYLDFAEEQRRRHLSIGMDDERLGYWREFTERGGGEFFPRFPLDLGVAPGRMYPIVNDASRLLDPAEADALEEACAAVGGKAFMGVLAAVAIGLREAGGPSVYRGFMPVSERGLGPWRHSVGWFVNTLPIEFDVSPELDFAGVMDSARRGFKEMIGQVELPFVRAWELLAPREYALKAWPYPVNFFSYIDTRKCPGALHHDEWRPTTHVWSARANGACSWFQRDNEGLHMNTIHVDTPQARRTMAALNEALRETVRTIGRTGGLGSRVPAVSGAREGRLPVRVVGARAGGDAVSAAAAATSSGPVPVPGPAAGSQGRPALPARVPGPGRAGLAGPRRPVDGVVPAAGPKPAPPGRGGAGVDLSR
ncbi:condensation domain-containing protein [Streptomyces sp. BI20]|uniref:condensation domain-containing protein n=1 Tax=Streptomyces sp. BI20 TaxID=3403460 RepID=UPI003C7527D3